jgi:hypothetical protein
MQLGIGETEDDLFRACTTVALGNGNNIKFWIHSHSPKEFALNIYKLECRKNYTIAQGALGGGEMEASIAKDLDIRIDRRIHKPMEPGDTSATNRVTG